MDSRRTRRRQGGFSLVEVLVAVTLLAVGALAAVTMQRTAVHGNRAAAMEQRATAMADELLEAVQALDYKDSRIDQTSGFTTPAASLLEVDGSDPGTSEVPGATRTWEITDDTPIANVKTIRVRVTWNEVGRSRQIELRTLKAQ